MPRGHPRNAAGLLDALALGADTVSAVAPLVGMVPLFVLTLSSVRATIRTREA
jgi:hypothetical protein